MSVLIAGSGFSVRTFDDTRCFDDTCCFAH